MSVLSKLYFHDEAAAFAYLESVLWPNGPVCPHCFNADAGRIYELKGKTTRLGLKKCADCRRPFTAKVGTVFESAHIPLHKMLQAVFLLTSSKKGISAHQLHRVLEITYKSAWFLAHRIREAMREGKLAVPFGSNGGAVEVDETFIGHDKAKKKRRGTDHKYKVLSLVDRNTGRARSVVIDDLKVKTIAPIVQENVDYEARLMTDEAGYYTRLGREFAEHGVVRHNVGEYGRGDIHTNTVEGFFSIFKRGMKGIYQHCGQQHLHRHLAEFDFRYNERAITDRERSQIALRGIAGKRLTYRNPDS